MSRIKNTFWVTFGLFSIFILVTLPPGLRNSLKSGTTSVFQPFLTAVAVTVNTVKRHTKGIIGYRVLLEENKRLKHKLFELEKQIVELQEASSENQRLRGLLSFKEQIKQRVIPARVIGRDSSVWFSSILIDKGTSSGIREGMPVISQQGLAGRVIATGPWSSQVMLITDINSRVSVLVQNSREEGVATGEGSNLIRVKYLSLDPDVHLGDLVITSGLDRSYPKGLVVGNIWHIVPEPDGLTMTAVIKPSADLLKLEEVLCLDIENGS